MTNIQFRLTEWARWHRGGAIRRGVDIGSLEGNYRSKQGDHWWYGLAPVVSKQEAPDADDAWEIELAARCISVNYHLLLWIVYIYRETDPRTIAKMLRRSKLKLRWYPQDMQFKLASAHSLIIEQLGLPAVVRMARSREWFRHINPTIVESGVEAPTHAA